MQAFSQPVPNAVDGRDWLQLKTFQPLPRVDELRRAGILVGSWAHVLRGTERAYAAAVAAMAERGIDTDGRPPIWAWWGPVALIDALMLLDEEHELSRGFATITFKAPADIVLLSDYAHWCNALEANSSTWRPRTPEIPRPGVRDDEFAHPAQACLPYLREEWVVDVVELPTSGWGDIDPAEPV